VIPRRDGVTVAVSEDDETSKADGLQAGLRTSDQDEQNCDEYVSAGTDGEYLAAYYPRGSLVVNSPGTASYDPSLPIGVLSIDQVPQSSSSTRLPAISHPGFELVASSVLEVASNANNNDGPDAAWAAVAFKFYKPRNGDADPNFNYRTLFASGSTHGGNSDHLLYESRLRNRINVSGPATQELIGWKPTSTRNISGTTDTFTITLTSGAPGVTASASETITVWKDSYGPFFIDPDTRFDWGYSHSNPGKGCGGSPCDYIGHAGGSEFKYRPADGYAKRVQVRICWDSTNIFVGSECEWGS
jgi:hypothetical protein